MFKSDMKNVFGQSDEVFRDIFADTLSKLAANKDRSRTVHFGLKRIIAVIAACLVFTTTALAFAMTRGLGVTDFIGGGLNLTNAPDVLQNDLEQSGGHTDLAEFTVREAVFDGSDIYIVLSVSPLDNDILLVPMDYDSNEPNAEFYNLFEGKTGTFGNYAKTTGKTTLLEVEFDPVGYLYGNSGSISWRYESGGALVYMLSSIYTGDETDELNVSLPCFLWDVTSDSRESGPPNFGAAPVSREPVTTLAFTIKNTGYFATAVSVGPMEYADCGVRVDKVTLTASEISVKAEVEYTVTDAEKFAAADDGLCFEFLDDSGGLLPQGPGNSGGVKPLNDANTRFVQGASLQAMETLPEYIIMRGFNCWSKIRYENHKISLRDE